MEAEGEVALVGSEDGSLTDPYDMAMAQMQAHMMIVDGDNLEMENHSLDGASAHSDEELRIIMDPESRTGFVPLALAPKVARGSGGGSGGSRVRSGGSQPPRTGTRSVGGTRASGASGAGAAGGSQRGGRKFIDKENRSRAPPKKSYEPDPFLSIDTLPTQKQVIHRQSTPSRGQVAARKKQQSSGQQTRAPPGTPSHPVFNVSRSRMSRNASRGVSSAVSSEWNPLIPRQKPLSGTVLENPVNKHVKVPFKHNVNKPDLENVVRPMSPGQTMKERTVLATFHVARTMARQHGEEDDKPHGRLLKGRLKPLYPVKSEGPSMQQCRGVVAEENKFMNGTSRTVARRRKIMAGMLSNKDFNYDRPHTAESLHNTSVASDMSDGREKDLDEMVDRQKDLALPTPPQDGMREPPNSLASASDPNFRHNMNQTSASGLSSDVFEIEEIPKTIIIDGAQPSTIKEVSASTERIDIEQRPSTSKNVRFAEKEEEDGKKIKKEEASNDGCKPNSEPQEKRKPDDDPDNSGPGQGPSGDQGQGLSKGQDQSPEPGKQTNHGQRESKDEGGEAKDSEKDVDDVDEKILQAENNPLRASRVGTILFTEEDISFPRMGTVLPPKKKKSTKKKTSLSKPAESKLSSKSAESFMDITVGNAGCESPTKDFYEKPAGRPKTAMTSEPSRKPLLLSRPTTASVPTRGDESQVQLVVRPVDSELTGEHDFTSPRLNEFSTHIPLSARTQASSGVLHGIVSREAAMEPTLPRRKEPQPAVEFKLEGSKMEQVLKSGVCTECGKPTTKIAEYWEETGALVCDLCDRKTRAEEDKKIDWIRKQMSTVYRGDCNDEGNPVEPVFMLTEHGEDDGINNLNDLEKALDAINSEISEAIKDNQSDEPFYLSEDSDSEDEELLALTNGSLDDPSLQPTTEHLDGNILLDEEPEKITTGQISKLLTEMGQQDKKSLSEHEMRVYWYQQYSQSQERLTSAKLQERLTSAKSQERNNSAKKRQPEKAPKAEVRNKYEELKQIDANKLEGAENMAGQQLDDPVTELLQINKSPAKNDSVQHFKGQRIEQAEDGNLGVSGMAKKLLRPPSAKKVQPEPVAPFAPLCFRINARPPPGFLYYFAYGTDMNPDRMSTYVQRAMSAGRVWGLLYGFQLVFNKRGVDEEAGGFPNIQFEPGTSVEGCLYLITLDELDKVDRHVGYPEHYDHAMVPVWLLNSNDPNQYGVAQYCVPALVLVAKDEWIHKGAAPLCADYAIQQCVKGGGDLMSTAYREHLTALSAA